jgi:DNA-binding PadR family transcriptional regulator
MHRMSDQLGRWADPALLVMASLADGPKHGYAITQDLASTVEVKMGPGTLYGVIARLEDRGLIEALPPEDRRRPYRLTASGVEALQREATRMRTVANLGLARLTLRPVGT